MQKMSARRGYGFCVAGALVCLVFAVAAAPPHLADWDDFDVLMEESVATRPDIIYPPSDTTFTHTMGLRLFDPDGFPRLTNTPPTKSVGDVPVWMLRTVETNGWFLTASGGMAVHSNGVVQYDGEARARAKYGDPPPWVAADPSLLEEWHHLRRRERVEMSLFLVPEDRWDDYTAALAAAMAGVPQPGAPAPVAPADTNRVAFARFGGAAAGTFNFDLYTPGDLPVDIFSKTDLAGGPLWSYAGTVQAAAPFTPAAVPAPHATLFLHAARGDIDSDGDGIPDGMELLHFGTDPDLWDTCGDGLSGWEEIYRYGLDPLLRDSDGDGIDDSDEIAVSYSRTDRMAPFDTSGGTNLVSWFPDVDDSCLTVTLPLPVSVGGMCYTTATLDMNGLIYLWPAHTQPVAPSSRFSNVDLAQATLADRSLVLAPFWDDLKARPAELGTSIVVADVTRHGKHYCVIEYKDMSFYGAAINSNNMISFQVALPQTGTNEVAFIYVVANGRGTGWGATVGLQGAGGSPNLPISYNIPSNFSAGDVITFRLGTGTNPLLIDSDGDGLLDGQELALGTSPLLADTDDDGLPDGWEVAHGLAPLDSSGDNGAGGDPDLDGLSNWEELQYGTSPVAADTDGDGVPDMDYVKNGFAAAAPDDFAESPVSVGDPSGSDSERWNITLAPLDEGGRTYVVASGGYGEMKTLPLRLQRGHRYRATLQHRGTRLEAGPDYDWEAQVCGLPAAKVLAAGQTHGGASRWFASAAIGVAVNNADGLLGKCNQDFSDVNNTLGKTAIIYVPVVDAIVASSDKSGNGAQQFPGHQAWPIALTNWSDPGKHMVVYFKDVTDAGRNVMDFDINLLAMLHPQTIPHELFGESWRKISGPDSGFLSRTDTFNVLYRNPKVGGIYKLGFDLGVTGLDESEANIILPLAGAEIDHIVRADIARADAFAARVLAIYTPMEINSWDNGMEWFVRLGHGDYLGRPNNAISHTIRKYNQVNDEGKGAVATWCGVPVKIAKASNFMVAYACRKIQVNSTLAWIAGVLIGTQNDSSARKSWDAGWSIGGGADYGTTVSNLVTDIWDKHQNDDKNQKLWPNHAPADNYVAPEFFFGAQDSRFTSPTFLYMDNP